MIEWFKRRKVQIGDKVHVYRNLHKDSIVIRCAKTGLVAGYCDIHSAVRVNHARFFVSKSGRERVLERRVRSVHAWSFLAELDVPMGERDQYAPVYYQPYKTPTFIQEQTGDPIFQADSVLVAYDRAYVQKSYSSSYVLDGSGQNLAPFQ